MMKVRLTRCKKCMHFRDMGGNALHTCNAVDNICCEDVDYRKCRFDPKPEKKVESRE